MGTTKKSTKCKVCNRTVRYDSVTFPYCNYHAILKNSSSKIFVDSTQSNLAEAREIMYNPSRTIRSNTTETLFILSNDSKVKLKTVAQTFKKWKNKTKNLDIYNPQQMYDARDDILDNINTTLSKDYDTEYLQCSKGKMYIPTMGLCTTSDHRILYVEDEDGSFIVDGATSAPLHSIISDNVNNHFRSGNNTCGDGLYISGMFEFNKYTSIRYNTIESEENGEVFGVNNSSSDDSDIEAQRNLIEKYGYDDNVAARPTYLSSATDYMNKEEKDNSNMNKEEPETVEDIIDML